MLILPQLIANALITGCIYALAAVGLALAFGAFRILNFAHGHCMMLGGYLFYFFQVEQGFSTTTSILLTLTAALPCSMIFQRWFIQPFYRINVLLPFISTLGLSIILESAISMIFGVSVLSVQQTEIIEPIQFSIGGGQVSLTHTQLILVVGSIIISALLAWCVRFSSLGLRFRALQESSYIVSAFGINADRLGYVAFYLSTSFAFLSGIALAFETNLQPTMGSYVMLKAFAAMVVGGLGNIPGAVFGAFLLSLIENLSVGIDIAGYSIPASFKDSVAFFIILFVLLWKPQGIFSPKLRAA